MNNCDNSCLICFDEFTDNHHDFVIKLSCGHRFCYECILDSYKFNFNEKNYKKKKNQCPYCRKNGGLLPFIKGKYIKGIHISPTKVKTINKPNINKLIYDIEKCKFLNNKNQYLVKDLREYAIKIGLPVKENKESKNKFILKNKLYESIKTYVKNNTDVIIFLD